MTEVLTTAGALLQERRLVTALPDRGRWSSLADRPALRLRRVTSR
jgi:hypothetical protein